MKINLSGFFKKEYLFLYLILITGSLLRLQGVLTNSFAYTYDVGRDMLALWDIVYAHNITLIGPTTGLPGVFYGPWWYFLLIPPFILFSGDPSGIAFTMVVIGIISIVVAYILGNKIGGKFLGLSFAAIISTSPVMVFLSTQIWNPNIIPLFVLLVLLVLYKIFEQNKKSKLKYYFLLGLLLFFTIDLEIVFGLLLTIGIVLSVLIIVNKKIRLKEIALFILGAILVSSPRIIFELRHEFLMTKSFIRFLTTGESSQSLGIIDVFVHRANILFDYFNSALFMEIRGLGFIALFFIVVTVLHFYRSLGKIDKDIILTSFIVVIAFLLGTTFFSHDIWSHYIVGLPIFYILIFVMCLNILITKLKNIILPALAVIFIFTINFNPVSFISSLNKPIFEGDASVYRNQLGVVDYVYNLSNGKDFKYVVYTPPVHDYTYRYLFLWYGPKKYGYKASVKSDTAYFILEPDLQYPTRLTDWLKSREKDGEIIREDKVRGGVVVQTRKVN